jgi:hypothetical protein
MAQHCEMAGLADFIGDAFQQWSGFGCQLAQRVVPLGDFEQFEGQEVPVIRRNLTNVSTLFKPNEHTKNLPHRSPQTSGDFAGVQAVGFSSKKFENVETFVQGWRGIAFLARTVMRVANCEIAHGGQQPTTKCQSTKIKKQTLQQAVFNVSGNPYMKTYFH